MRPRTDQPGPWDQDVLVYHVTPDGHATRLATFPRAGVPTIARLQDGRLAAAHQHFPEDNGIDFDKVAVHFSTDEGKSWTDPRVIALTGLTEGMRFPFDPTLVPLPDGRVRLYFTSARQRPPFSDPNERVPAIYSAISSNSIDFTVEPGRRFGIEGRPVIDCAVALHNGTFHLYSPDNGVMPPQIPGQPPRFGGPSSSTAGYHATSTDGLVFTRADDVRIEGGGRWLGGAYSDGRTMTFFGTGRGIWSATSADGAAWRLSGSWMLQGADPGAVPSRDGGWIVTGTGPPRPGTPSDRRRGR